MRTFHFDFVDDGYSPPTGSGSYSFEMKEIIYIPPDPPDPLPGYYGFVFRDADYVASSPYSFEFTLGSGICEDEWIEHEADHWPEDSARAWGDCEDPFTYLRQIWTDENYVYAATTDGLNIIDLISEQAYAQVTYRDGLNSVWADDTNVYMATTNSGVKYIEKTVISGTELVQHLTDYLNDPEILSDKVRYIHGNGEHMLISTAAGINYRGPDAYYQRTYSLTEISRKVFVTSDGKIYYTTWNGITWRINIKNNGNSDWTVSDKYYESESFLIPGPDILDIFVTEGTSDTGINNTLFVATTSGVSVIDEELDEGAIYYTV